MTRSIRLLKTSCRRKTHTAAPYPATWLGANPNTPRDEDLSAGMVCFEVKGMKPEQGVRRLLDQQIIISTTPYRVTCARVACGIVNTPEEVNKTLRAIRQLA